MVPDSASSSARLCLPGAIAQLGERLPCTQEVSGSIPLGSIGKLLLIDGFSWSWERSIRPDARVWTRNENVAGSRPLASIHPSSLPCDVERRWRARTGSVVRRRHRVAVSRRMGLEDRGRGGGVSGLRGRLARRSDLSSVAPGSAAGARERARQASQASRQGQRPGASRCGGRGGRSGRGRRAAGGAASRRSCGPARRRPRISVQRADVGGERGDHAPGAVGGSGRRGMCPAASVARIAEPTVACSSNSALDDRELVAVGDEGVVSPVGPERRLADQSARRRTHRRAPRLAAHPGDAGLAVAAGRQALSTAICGAHVGPQRERESSSAPGGARVGAIVAYDEKPNGRTTMPSAGAADARGQPSTKSCSATLASRPSPVGRAASSVSGADGDYGL